jgi:hypothetical protein
MRTKPKFFGKLLDLNTGSFLFEGKIAVGGGVINRMMLYIKGEGERRERREPEPRRRGL